MIAPLNSIHLNGLRAVEAVARTGSLQAAAEELGVSASAVSQHVNRAEAQLGRPVFERTPRGLAPTEQGAAFTARLSAGFRELATAVENLRRDSESTLLVSVAPAFATRWLIPRLSRLFARHPEILVRIDASARMVDLGHSDIDLAIRLGSGKWPGVEADLLLAQTMFPVCAPAIAARLGEIADLAGQTVLRDDNAMFGWADWFSAVGHAPVALTYGARFSDPLHCLDATIGGNGVMLAWELLAADALASGRLVAPFGTGAASGYGYWLCRAPGRTVPRRVSAFRRWIVEEIGGDRGGKTP